MTRAAIYTRVSGTTQENDGYSLPTQRDSCRQRAAERGYTVVAEWEETYTGKLLWERPKLQELMAMVRTGKIDVILVHALDRLSRIEAHRSFIRVDLARHGATIESVTEQADETLTGKMIQVLTGLYAEYELVVKQERTERGRKARAESGKPISASLPFGYRWADPDAGKKTRMVIHEPEAAIVRRIFDWLVGGGSATALTYALNAEGIPCPKAREGRRNLWSVRTIGRIARDDAYIGKAWAHKSQSRYEGGKRIRLPNRPEAERIPLPAGTTPPIVDVDTFTKAGERLIRNRREATRNQRHAELYLLRGGFAKCHHCGGTLEACIAPRGDRYYRCQPLQRRKYGCPSCSIKADELEAGVWEYVRLVLENPDYIRQHARKQAESDSTAADLATIDAALVQLSQQAANIASIAAMTNDPDAAAPLALRLDGIAAEKRTLQTRRQTLIDLQAAHSRTKAMLDGLSDIWAERYAEIDAMTMDERRDVLADFRVTVTVYPKGVEPRYVVDMAFDLSSWFVPATGFLLDEPDDSPDTLAEWEAVGGGGIAERQPLPVPWQPRHLARARR